MGSLQSYLIIKFEILQDFLHIVWEQSATTKENWFVFQILGVSKTQVFLVIF